MSRLIVKPRDPEDLSLGYDVWDGDSCLGWFPYKAAADQFVQQEDAKSAEGTGPISEEDAPASPGLR